MGLRLVVRGGFMVGWGRGVGWGMAIGWGRGVGRGGVDNSMGTCCMCNCMSYRGVVHYSLMVDRAGVVHKGSHRVVVHRGVGGSRGRGEAIHLALCLSRGFSLHQAGQGQGREHLETGINYSFINFNSSV